MPFLLPGSDWTDAGASSLGLDLGVKSSINANEFGNLSLDLPSIPSYSLIASPSLSPIDLMPSPTAPDSSGGFISSIGDWFKTASNSGIPQTVIGASGGIGQAVASFFKGKNTAPNKANTGQAAPGASGGFFNSMMGGISSGWQSATQGIGTGLGNITGGTIKPLVPALIIIAVGLFIFFLIMLRR